MARAKRTDRAEARRQYRAYLAAQAEAQAAAGVVDEDERAEDRGASARPARARAAETGPQPGQRLGILASARAAFRTPHYVDDIRNIRALVLQSNAIWPAFAICVVAGAYTAVRLSSSGYRTDAILPFLVQFVFFPPLLPAMLAGFLAPRSTWLAGIIAAFIASITLVIALAISGVPLAEASNTGSNSSASPSASSGPTVTGSESPSPTGLATSAPSSGTPSPSTNPAGTASGTTGRTTPSDLLGLTISLLAQSLALGALIAAGSGWYKRFLDLMGGGRPRGPSRPSGQKRPVRKGQTARR